jgi:hypothetical protein
MLKLRILAVALLSSTLLLIASCADWRSYSYDSTHFSRPLDATRGVLPERWPCRYRIP